MKVSSMVRADALRQLPRRKLQLCGVTAMLIASKYEAAPSQLRTFQRGVFIKRFLSQLTWVAELLNFKKPQCLLPPTVMRPRQRSIQFYVVERAFPTGDLPSRGERLCCDLGTPLC